MWVRRSSRQELLDIVQGKVRPDRGYAQRADSDSLPLPDSSELLFVWRELGYRFIDLPSAVIMQPGRLRDFLAWTWTYLPQTRPFSSYCRVIQAGRGVGFPFAVLPPGRGFLESAWLGLVLGEALTYLGRQPEARQLTLTSCASTFSYAVARADWLGLMGGESAVGSLAPEWSLVRRITKQPQLPIPLEALEGVCLSLTLARRDIRSSRHPLMPELVDALLTLGEQGDITEQQWNHLTGSLPGALSLRKQMHGSREAQVRVAEDGILRIGNAPNLSPLVSGFLIGYLVDRIAPGTMEHAGILWPYAQHMNPSVLLWYGLCAGLAGRATLLNYSGGLGRRIIRDITALEGVLDPPRADFSLEELEMLLEAGGTAPFRTAIPGVLTVEIAPCVTTLVRWPSRLEGPGDAVRQPDLFGSARVGAEEIERLRAAVQDSLQMTQRLQECLQTALRGSARSDLAKTSRRRKR
jgi:hypothetical protein